MRLCLLWLLASLLASTPALAQAQQRLTPAQLRELERQARLRSEKARQPAQPRQKAEKQAKQPKEPEPKPVDCKLPGARRAAQFSQEALPGIPLADRYALYVGACGLGEVVALTQRLVRFQTVNGEQPPAKNPQVAAMGRFLQQWAKARGFGFRVAGRKDVFELSWGEGAPFLGLVFHGDVVPALPHEWEHKPFEPRVVEGRLRGRGVLDNKGPLATALVSLALAREMGLTPHKGRVLVIIGNDKESSWLGMQEYARTERLPTHVLSVDAEYPVVVAQSGFAALTLEAPLGPVEATQAATLLPVEASAGEQLTQIPAAASLSLEPFAGGTVEQGLAAVKAAVEAVRKERSGFEAEVKLVPGGRAGSRIAVSTRGKAAEASYPEQGRNALWDLAAIAGRLPLADNGLTAMLRTVARRFDGDHRGERLGFTGKDALMGAMAVAPTVLRVKEGKVSLRVTLHRPRSAEGSEDFHQALDHALALIHQETDGRVAEGPGRYVGEPHVADARGVLATTLMGIYRRHRGLSGEPAPVSIRGSTYARLFPGGVDFGPGLKEQGPATGHAPDESISLEHLGLSTQMLAEALYTLALSPPAP